MQVSANVLEIIELTASADAFLVRDYSSRVRYRVCLSFQDRFELQLQLAFFLKCFTFSISIVLS